MAAWECGLAHVRKSQYESQCDQPQTRVEATYEATCKRARTANVSNGNIPTSYRDSSSRSLLSGVVRSLTEQETQRQFTQVASFGFHGWQTAPWRSANLRRKVEHDVQLSMRGSKHEAADREQTARYHQQRLMKTRSAVRYKRPNKDLHTCASHALAPRFGARTEVRTCRNDQKRWKE